MSTKMFVMINAAGMWTALALMWMCMLGLCGLFACAIGVGLWDLKQAIRKRNGGKTRT